jgi:hypothetical protein
MIDAKQTDDGDLDFTSGDLEMMEPTGQHQRDILIAAPGDYKESPTVGVDSVRYLLDVDPATYLRTIRKQLSADGQKVKALSYNDYTGKVDIDAEYENS